MDDQTFDGWTRLLATGESRRAALRRLAGGALGGLLAVRGLRPAGAVPPGYDCNPGQPCPDGYHCAIEHGANGRCVRVREPGGCGDGPPCGAGLTCCNRTCVQHTAATCHRKLPAFCAAPGEPRDCRPEKVGARCHCCRGGVCRAAVY